MTTQMEGPIYHTLRREFGEGRSWSLEEESIPVWELNSYHLVWSSTNGADSRLRGLWAEKKGNFAFPVVLLAPGRDEMSVRVLGPQKPAPAREIPFDSVLDLLLKVRTSSPHEAASVLAREFSRLEESVVPGLRVKDLLTPHFVRERLVRSVNRDRLERSLQNFPDRVKPNMTWRTLFTQFGYRIERLPMRGYLLRWEDAPVAVIHPLQSVEMFSRLDETGALPEGILLADCEHNGADWGLLAAEGRLRLFQNNPAVGAATNQHIEFNLGELRREDRFYLGLLAPESLRNDGYFTEWSADARDFGEALRRGLEERLIADALPNIARGLGAYLEERGADLDDRDQLRRIEEAALTLVFRFMFLLHTEARGYLPIGSVAYRPHSARQIAEDSRAPRSMLSGVSTQRWDRLRTLVKMIRVGDPSVGVPAYNGSLFAADGFPGSALLEESEITDNYLAPALAAIAYETDKPDAPGLDFAGLQIGHLGAIYEALLTIRLNRAVEDLAYDAKKDTFRPIRAGEEPEVTRAHLFYQAEAGGRKAGGVFYTRREFVRHLLENSLVPALEEHFQRVRDVAKTDPAEAARRLFDFSVIDPAMGSAHFLTAALDMMTDRFELFLAEIGGLPAIADLLSELREQSAGTSVIEDGDLLRRLILKRCIFGVDLSPMAVEVANVTLWLASFVPGLALSYLGSNLKCGDALIGVASPDVVGGADSPMFTGQAVSEAMRRAADLQTELSANPDRTPEEVKRSMELEVGLRDATVGLRTAFDLWTAEPLGLDGARHLLEINSDAIIEGSRSDATSDAIQGATELSEMYRFFHWPLEFPNVFHRESPGFDVVVGNPPWNEITIEELAFYALRDPGLRGLPDLNSRRQRIATLDRQHPEYRLEFEAQREELKTLRAFYSSRGGYQLQGVGDKDLYQLFCERYTHLVRQDGRLGVVLPRTAFLSEGAKAFRQWLFSQNTVSIINFLLNSRRWAFDMEVRYTVALLMGQRHLPRSDHSVKLTGPSRNLAGFIDSASSGGVEVAVCTLGASRVVPLVPAQRHADVLAKMRQGIQFDSLQSPENLKNSSAAASRLAPGTELHETQQRSLFSHATGVPVWKGRCFDQYSPHGNELAGYAVWDDVLEFVQNKRRRSPVFRRMYSAEILNDPDTHPIHSCRIAFRDVSRSTDSRTIRACLIPPKTPLTNKAPYLIFSGWSLFAQAYVLGVMNSLPFDWIARRYVETNLNYFILNMLPFPTLDNTPWHRVGELAARLSCVDARFGNFAEDAGVECGPLTDAERADMRAEIDALVAHAYDLTSDELRFIFTDFTENAISPAYRSLVMDKFEESAAKWLAEAGGSSPDIDYIPRRRSEIS